MGHTPCPITNDTELFYKGKAAGDHYNQPGGGANYIFLSKEPEFLSYTHQSYIYGAEYGAHANSGSFSIL